MMIYEQAPAQRVPKLVVRDVEEFVSWGGKKGMCLPLDRHSINRYHVVGFT